jgi:hypothetical protein
VGDPRGGLGSEARLHKTEPDRIPLQVEIRPKAILAFGVGKPPDAAPIVIDDGWNRVAGWHFHESAVARLSEKARNEVVVARVDADDRSGEAYHVYVSRHLREAHDFNLTSVQLLERYIEPWRAGRAVFLAGRRWDLATCRVRIYRGPRFSAGQRPLGRTRRQTIQLGDDVTDHALRER